ncbi:MAG: arginase family protein [Vicinamibacterales bacterium]
MIHPAWLVLLPVAAAAGVVSYAEAMAPDGQPARRLKVSLVRNRSEGPAVMEREGLESRLAARGCDIIRSTVVELTPEEDRQYGAWNKTALENRSLGRLAATAASDSDLVIGLLTNCSDLLGMLAGLQRPAGAATAAAPTGLAGVKPRRVGLVWVDAHADFNTPETTLSGMLGGMPVAIAAGMCLTRHRQITGLDPALPTRYIVMAGLRDVDPLEQELLDRSDCQMLSVADIRGNAASIARQMERLAALTDVIYVHIDMDVLDPSEVAGHPLTAPEGPTSRELAAALQTMFEHPKAAAIGIASLPFGERDKGRVSLEAAYRLIEGAVDGVRRRRE